VREKEIPVRIFITFYIDTARKKKSSQKEKESGPVFIEDEVKSSNEISEKVSDDILESEGLFLDSESSIDFEEDDLSTDEESDEGSNEGSQEDSQDEAQPGLQAEAGAEVAVTEAGENELSHFESAEIEELEFVEYDKLMSIVESLLFSTDRPLTVDAIRAVFKGTNVKGKDIRSALEDYSIKLAAMDRGVSLEEIGGGYQLRTKIDNAEFMKKHVKGRAFKLSGPALEVLSIVAYKQPCIKADVDEIRGVESGHLMRALLDRGIIRFGGKSELPGKPMYYETTRRFLEIFGLRSVQELPSLSQIDELIPDGIGEIEEEKKTLKDLTPELSIDSALTTYSDGESELLKISDQLSGINTSSDFFEKEKARQKRKREEERAQDIREAMMLGQDVEDKDVKWLKRFEQTLENEKIAAAHAASQPQAESTSANDAIAEDSEAVVLDARTESDQTNQSEQEESSELSDEEILAKVDFEMTEEKFKGEEVQGVSGTDFDEASEENEESEQVERDLD
jgi:segregation and condensation protein B